MKRTLAICVAVALSASAFAQSRSSFLYVSQISGITVTQQNGGLDYNIAVGATPTFTYNSTVYTITSVWGFWLMRDNDPDLLNPTNSNIGVWNAHNSTSGAGEIAGWHSTPTTGITPGNNLTLGFQAVNAAAIDRYGFHVSLPVGTGFPGGVDNTGFITLVPEPGTLTAVALGALALLRRKRRI